MYYLDLYKMAPGRFSHTYGDAASYDSNLPGMQIHYCGIHVYKSAIIQIKIIGSRVIHILTHDSESCCQSPFRTWQCGHWYHEHPSSFSWHSGHQVHPIERICEQLSRTREPWWRCGRKIRAVGMFECHSNHAPTKFLFGSRQCSLVRSSQACSGRREILGRMAESKGFLMSIVHGRRCAATFLYQCVQCRFAGRGVIIATASLQTRSKAFIFKQYVVICSPTHIDACTSWWIWETYWCREIVMETHFRWYILCAYTALWLSMWLSSFDDGCKSIGYGFPTIAVGIAESASPCAALPSLLKRCEIAVAL